MQIFQVDAFTDQPFTGNPACVYLVDDPLDELWMQQFAAEMNLSETAFVERREGSVFSLRWFTPAAEVDLCGHATLASAHILWVVNSLDPDETVQFDTRSGRLSARQSEGLIELDFPADPPAPDSLPNGMVEALGCAPVYTGRAINHALIEVDSPDTLRRLAPDFGAMKSIDPLCCIVTSISDDPAYDFFSRYFAPGFGIDEDPVTGSAHCCLGPYWSGKLGKTDLVGRQISARGGTVRVSIRGDRILLAGHAVTIMRSTLAEAVNAQLVG